MNLGEKEIRRNVAFGSGARGPKSLPCQAVLLCHPPPTCAAQAKLKIQSQNVNPSFFWLDFCFLLPKPPTEVSFPLPVFIPVGIHQGLLRCCTNHSQPKTPGSRAHIFSLGFQSTNCTVAVQPLSSGQASRFGYQPGAGSRPALPMNNPPLKKPFPLPDEGCWKCSAKQGAEDGVFL